MRDEFEPSAPEAEMKLQFRDQVKNLLTVGYLFSAIVITTATSKSPDHGVEMTPVALNATLEMTNYQFSSNCAAPTQLGLQALRVEGNAITKVIDAQGVSTLAAGIDFTDFGFPNATIVVGADVVGKGASVARKCIVSGTTVQVNGSYNQSQINYAFLRPGFLSAVSYDCYNGNAYDCSIALTEEPAGDLK